MVLLPVPVEPPLGKVIQESLVAAVQVHPLPVVSAKLELPAAAVTSRLIGSML